LSQTVLSDALLTFAEKIISVKADGGRKVHHAGEIAILPADMAMAQDSTGPLTVKVFREKGVEKVWGYREISLENGSGIAFRLCPESPDSLRNPARQ